MFCKLNDCGWNRLHKTMYIHWARNKSKEHITNFVKEKGSKKQKHAQSPNIHRRSKLQSFKVNLKVLIGPPLTTNVGEVTIGP